MLEPAATEFSSNELHIVVNWIEELKRPVAVK